jgi:hypothetical protein
MEKLKYSSFSKSNNYIFFVNNFDTDKKVSCQVDEICRPMRRSNVFIFRSAKNSISLTKTISQQYLLDILQKTKLSLSHIAKLLNLSLFTLYRIHNGKVKNPRMPTFRKILGLYFALQEQDWKMD